MRATRSCVLIFTFQLFAAAIGGSPSPSFAAEDDTVGQCGAVQQRPAGAGPEAKFGAYLGLAGELAAAEDCIKQERAGTACEHFARAIAILKEVDPVSSEDAIGRLRARMQVYDCP